MTLDYPFTEREAYAAHCEWGANCGPTALAFALQRHIDTILDVIPGFQEKHYTSPTMMRSALANLGAGFDAVKSDACSMFDERVALVRIQWTGPWTKPGANPRWAYRKTHWIATWLDGQSKMVFDCNGGIRDVYSWEVEIVPVIVATIPKADGGYFPTHFWRLNRQVLAEKPGGRA